MGSSIAALSAYSFLGVLVAAARTRTAAAGLSCGIAPRESAFGDRVDLVPAAVPGRRILALPGIALRYEVDLRTRDGRRFYAAFDPYRPRAPDLEQSAPGRGAYFGGTDRLRCFDAFGLFTHSRPVTVEASARLLVRPRTAADFRGAELRAGGSSRRVEPHYRKTEDLTEHRPYTPGDDPRRINWKLYGHSGDLFVREGESEPPPRSRISILLDGTADGRLYGEEEARRAVDALAELALALTVESAALGRSVFLGYCGSTLNPADPTSAARLLAYPAALSPLDGADLPLPDEGAGTVVLALPRKEDFDGALDRFIAALKGRDGGRAAADLRFLAAGSADEAEACVRRYGTMGGIHADLIET